MFQRICILLTLVILLTFSETDGEDTDCGRTKYDSIWADRFKVSPSERRKRVVGGLVSREGNFPWLVSLMIQADSKIHICGGTLISDRWVLTGAQCFEPNSNFSYLTTDPTKWTVRIGEFDMSVDDTPHEDFAVETIIIYPDRAEWDVNDIALVKLNKPVIFSEYVNVVCLPNQGESPAIGALCYVAGWGYTSESGSDISALRHAFVLVIPNDECDSNYKTLEDVFGPEFKLEIHPTMMCAINPDGGKDACQYDGGGPLICRNNYQWYVSGIISFGHGCGRAGYPGVYTRVSSFVEWISSVISS